MTALLLAALLLQDQEMVIGSKKFAEARILAEIIAEVAEQTGEARVIRKLGMGGTMIVYQALQKGQIDIYPEYTGTILHNILKPEERGDMAAALGSRGVKASAPLGFNNSYGLAMTRKKAESLGIRKITDLAGRRDLKLAFTHEFIGREDGWRGLVAHYGLDLPSPTGMDHSLSYEAVSRGSIDMMEVYTTDGKIRKYDLQILVDDRGFWPKYYGFLLFRTHVEKRFPKTHARLIELMVGKIPDRRMVELNSIVEVDDRPYAEAAAAFLKTTTHRPPTLIERTLQYTAEHLLMVGISLFFAILIGIPLGVVAAKRRGLGQGLLGCTEIVQAIPSLALFAALVAISLPIGMIPAVIALVLYSLLPIVRNTIAGLRGIDPHLIESAVALGLTPPDRLRLIELPLASPSILAGIKTAAVINVGTATLAALIGGGGLGVPIIEGLDRLKAGVILEGVIPAVLLAVAVRGLFELIERKVVPKGLRLKRA